ncbi:Opioid growth factor receptor-like protein 1 [Mactra antiquata]
MGSNPGKSKKQNNGPSTASQAPAERDWTERQMDMFQTESFRPGQQRGPTRATPAPSQMGPAYVESRQPRPYVTVPSRQVIRQVPMARPPRQEMGPGTAQTSMGPPVGRDYPRSTSVNPWLDDEIWNENGTLEPLGPIENTQRNRVETLTAFPAQPPPYQAIEQPVRRNPPPKPAAKQQPAPEPAQVAVAPASPVETRPEPVQALEGIPEETMAVDNDNPDFSNYVVPSLLSPEHMRHMPTGESRLNIAPPTVLSVHEKDDDEYIGANLKFYRNQVPFRPNGEFIDYIHRYWFKNYRLLEKNHNYIQWLFPISESSSVNREAVPLRAHEAKHIYADLESRSRFINSYKLMLDFFGFRVTDLQTGKIERKENWSDRFYNLLRMTHNYARITRILKSLGELGLGQYQSPFVMALLHEVFETKYLHGIPKNTIMYWIRAINNQFERDYVYKLFYEHIMKMENNKQYPGKENNGFQVDKRQHLKQAPILVTNRNKY